ncbi:MAG TPA: hypothetical protein VN200_10885, partial [Rhodoglobus sp.]|nr:hypothetical protein [Rhodoglobus sp.]
MNKHVSRGLLGVLFTGGLMALGAGVANAADTSGEDSLLGGTQAVVDAVLPVNIGGNSISIFGDSSSSDSSTGSSGASDSTNASTTGIDSVLGGTQAVIDAVVPVTVSGNAISVIGDSSSEGSMAGGTSGSGGDTHAATSGEDSLAGGTQAVIDAVVPVTVSG